MTLSRLEERVKEIIEESGGKSFAEDVLQYGCQSGTVSELIYYKDTHEWFDEYYSEIMGLVHELEESLGEKVHHDGDMKNWYAWLSFEETTRNLMDRRLIEDEEEEEDEEFYCEHCGDEIDEETHSQQEGYCDDCYEPEEELDEYEKQNRDWE